MISGFVQMFFDSIAWAPWVWFSMNFCYLNHDSLCTYKFYYYMPGYPKFYFIISLVFKVTLLHLKVTNVVVQELDSRQFFLLHMLYEYYFNALPSICRYHMLLLLWVFSFSCQAQMWVKKQSILTSVLLGYWGCSVGDVLVFSEMYS